MATREAAPIGESGKPFKDEKDPFTAKMKSEKYGFEVEITMSRSGVIAGHADLEWLGLYASLALASS